MVPGPTLGVAGYVVQYFAGSDEKTIFCLFVLPNRYGQVRIVNSRLRGARAPVSVRRKYNAVAVLIEGPVGRFCDG